MLSLSSQYHRFKQNPTSETFSFLVNAKKELYDEIFRVAEQAKKEIIAQSLDSAKQIVKDNTGRATDEVIQDLQKSFNKIIEKFTNEAVDKYQKIINEGRNIISGIQKGDKGDKGDDADESKIYRLVLNKVIANIPKPEKLNPKELQKIVSNEILAFFLRNPKKELSEEDVTKIAKGFQFMFDPNQYAEVIARAFEKLPYEKKLDYDTGLKNKPGVPVYKSKKSLTRGSSTTGFVVKVYDISPLLDGVTKTFTIPSNNRVISVHASSSPYSAFRPTVDFTYTNSSITFTSEIEATTVLSSGQSILIEYAES